MAVQNFFVDGNSGKFEYYDSNDILLTTKNFTNEATALTKASELVINVEKVVMTNVSTGQVIGKFVGGYAQSIELIKVVPAVYTDDIIP